MKNVYIINHVKERNKKREFFGRKIAREKRKRGGHG